MSFFERFAKRIRHRAEGPASAPAAPRARRCPAQPLDYYARLVEGDECQVCGQDLSGLLVEHYDHKAGWDVEGFSSPQWLYVTCLNGHPNSLDKLGYEPGVYYDQELAELVEFGDAAAVRDRLQAGVDPDTRDIFGTPLIVCAARRRREDVVMSLLRAGSDPNSADSEGKSALNWICRRGSVEGAAALLEAGAEVNAADPSGSTPLMKAAECNSIALVDLLLAHGAAVNARAPHGATALHIPAYEGHAEVVRSLVRAGADPEIKDSNGLTALDYAQQEQKAEIVAILRGRVFPEAGERP